MLTLSTHSWHCQANECVMDRWCRLYSVGGEDLGMLPQVEDEGVAGPPALDLHDVKGHTPQ